MVIGLIGENCSGKSTLAAHIREAIGAEVVTGRDYLRMARSEAEARRLFREKLAGEAGRRCQQWQYHLCDFGIGPA